jgi:uncharacterized repeat protein (TIGR03803 family)
MFRAVSIATAMSWDCAFGSFSKRSIEVGNQPIMSPDQRPSWLNLKSWKLGHATRTRDRRKRQIRPTVTVLEDRQLLALTTLASFNGTNGVYPDSGLVLDSQGNLYGATNYGGAANDGTVFEIAKGSNTITTLASFNGTNGANPNGGLVLDGQGNLYGGTWNDGANGNGAVFEIAKGSNTITTIASFNIANGAAPDNLVLDSQGNMYGITGGGGAYNDGTVFEIAKGSNTVTTLASFNGANGGDPSSVVIDSQGNLYGATYDYPGTVFEIAQGLNTITTLASFNGTNGAQPYGSVVLDSQGNLYGTTSGGGAGGFGIVFEIAKGSNTITTLGSFNHNNGADARSLVLDGQGNLYGTTFDGGAAGYGTVFELSGVAVPSSQTINFGPLAGQTYGVGPITLSATATSGLPVGFSVLSGPATLSGNVLTVTGAGTVVVQASQPGNGTRATASN